MSNFGKKKFKKLTKLLQSKQSHFKADFFGIAISIKPLLRKTAFKKAFGLFTVHQGMKTKNHRGQRNEMKNVTVWQ